MTPIPAGWKLVPIEPTPEMLEAARRAPLPAVMVDSRSATENLQHKAAYAAMLRAVTDSPASVAPGDAQDERQAVDQLPAYITDDRYHLQYRLGWNNCLADCRAAILADAPAAGDALDAARYRKLRRKVCIAGGQFHILNLAPTYVAPDAAVELDSVLDAALAAQVPHKGDAA